MDKIIIDSLVCRARVGVPEWERRRRQRVLIDLEFGLDLTVAGRSDRVEKTIDYAAAAMQAKRVAEGRPFQLVEAMAQAVAGELMRKFQPQELRVRIRKFSVPGARSVGVEIIRRGKGGRSRTKGSRP